MALKLKKISALPFAVVLCGIHAVVGLILGVIVTVGTLTAQEEGIVGLGAWSLLVFPVLNAILGFLAGLFLAGCYNFFAASLGGIELEMEES